MERIQKVSENLADFEIDSENLEQFLCAYSQKMKDVATEIRLYAPLDFPVVIEGASGTGKEVIATALHKLSGRSPFIVINMGEGPETLFESAIFGHKKGAFTGADQERTGFIGQAKNGTVFMDEINSLPRSLQPKLLRVLENGTYWPVGSSKIEKTQARFIFSSNQSLEELKSRGDLREDIFYRLGRIIRIPSLSERREDIPPITEKLLRIAKRKIDRGGRSHTKSRFSGPDLPVVTEAAMKKLTAYHWPEYCTFKQGFRALSHIDHNEGRPSRKFVQGCGNHFLSRARSPLNDNGKVQRSIQPDLCCQILHFLRGGAKKLFQIFGIDIGIGKVFTHPLNPFHWKPSKMSHTIY